MTDRDKLFWFIGLFEGEGSFSLTPKYAKWITITSTDRDVLERVQETFGGTIIKPTLRRENWKQEYVWYTTKVESSKLIKEMLPYLSVRRVKRANEWLEMFEKNMETTKLKETKRENLKTRVQDYRKTGMTQLEIANLVGYERSYIAKLLKD